MQHFVIEDTSFADLKLLKRKQNDDERGFFERFFCVEELSELCFQLSQMNRSFTAQKGALRGMHFQSPPFSETKIVSCLRGRVFDVALDLRRGSETFLKWHGEELSGDNHKSIVIPKGFAHGFQTLAEDCELLYLHDSPYNNEAEGQVNVFDSRAAIIWPLPVSMISKRDKNVPHLAQDFIGI